MAEEPETYDLADPDDHPEPSPTAKPPKPIESASPEPETFELDEPVINDPRAGNTPSRPPKPPIDPTPEEDDQPDEPVAVSPARAQAIREEQRIRAAQEQAEADAKKKKVILTLVSCVIVVAIVGFIALKMFG